MLDQYRIRKLLLLYVTMASLSDRIRARLFAGLARKRDLDRLYDQVAGLFQVQAAIEGRPILRRMRGWAISPDAMSWLLNDLQHRSNPAVVEFGCGQSTVIIASMLKLRTGGKLLSVEHDHEYARGIQQQLELLNLMDFVEFVFCPLVDIPTIDGGTPVKSYDLRELKTNTIDLALVDGPPVACGDTTRHVPLKWALDHLSHGGSAFLDDADRPGEQKLVDALRREFPGFQFEELDTEKGLVKFMNLKKA